MVNEFEAVTHALLKELWKELCFRDMFPGQSELFQPREPFLPFKVCSVFTTELSYCTACNLREPEGVCVCVEGVLFHSTELWMRLVFWGLKPMFF